MDWYADHRHGSARWPTQFELANAPLHSRTGVFIGLCPFTGNYLTLNGDAPMILIGGAGSGKGATMLLYNNFYDGSMLINNPKGEVGAIIAPYQRAMGKEYYGLNPTGLHTKPPWNLPQHKVNPLDILKPTSRYLVSDCKRIADMLIPLRKEGKTFFPKRGRQWLSFLLLAYVLTSNKATLSGFRQLLNMIEASHTEFISIATGLFSTLGNADIKRTCSEIIDKRKSAPEEYSGVMSTIYSDMDFMSDPDLQTLFSGADFSLDVLSQTNPAAVVDIAFPAENAGIWATAMRLIIGVAILYQYRNQASKPLFMIDEAAQLGHFEELEMSYTYGRSFYRTYAVFQDIGQIKSNYGYEGIQTFLGSSQARMFIGTRDYETAKLQSDMLGDQTIEVENLIYDARAKHAQQMAMNNLIFNNADPFQAGMELSHWQKERSHKDKMRRPLMTPDEILNMPEDESLVFLSGINLRPFKGKRRPYFQNPQIAPFFLPNPYHM